MGYPSLFTVKRYIPVLLLLIFVSCTPEQLEDLQKCVPRENIWKGAIVPYKFTENTPQYHRELMYQVMEHYEALTPLSFIEYTTDDFYSLPHGVLMKYTGENSVNSSYYPFGQGDYITDLRMGGERFFDLGTAIHELGHVAGLPHEFQRADRDEYLIIHWDNIPQQWYGNFKLTDIDFVTPLANVSVMHYDPKALAIDGSRPTVEMLDGSPVERSLYLSEADIKKINELYCYEIQNP